MKSLHEIVIVLRRILLLIHVKLTQWEHVKFIEKYVFKIFHCFISVRSAEDESGSQ